MEKKLRASSLKINFILNTFLQILSTIAPLLTAPYVSRVLGPDNIGIYSYTLSINAYFVMFAGLGTASYGIVEIAKVRDSTSERSCNFWGIELITVFTSLISLFVWFLMMFFYKTYWRIFLIMSIYIVAAMLDISWFYLGIEKLKYTVVVNSVLKILGVVFIFCFVKSRDDLLIYILILALSTFCGNLSMWLFLPKYVVASKVNFNDLKRHFKGTMVYFIPTIAATIYTVVDKTLIGIITKDNIENGCYEQATKIIGLVRAVAFTSMNTLFSSRMAYLFGKERFVEIKERLNFSIEFILLLSYGACFGIMAISREFVPVFFGEGYSRVVGFLVLMAPLIPIMGISSTVGYLYYNPSGNRKKSAKILVAGTTINCILNVVFINLYAGYGAVIASLIAEVIITALYISNSNGYVEYKTIWAFSWKKVVAGLSMVLVVRLLAQRYMFDSPEALLAQIIIGAISFMVVLYLLRDKFLLELFHRGLKLVRRT